MAQGLKESEIAGRYAKALYDLAHHAGCVDAVSQDMERIGRVIAASREVSRMLVSPLPSRAELSAFAKALAENVQASLTTQRFLALLAARRRLPLLPAAIAAFRARVAAARQEMTAHVTLAKAADAGQADAIAAQLSATLGKTVRVEVAVDPEILGGAVVRIGARRIDASVRGGLERLRQQLKAA